MISVLIMALTLGQPMPGVPAPAPKTPQPTVLPAVPSDGNSFDDLAKAVKSNSETLATVKSNSEASVKRADDKATAATKAAEDAAKELENTRSAAEKAIGAAQEALDKAVTRMRAELDKMYPNRVQPSPPPANVPAVPVTSSSNPRSGVRVLLILGDQCKACDWEKEHAVPTINAALGSNFRITNTNAAEAMALYPNEKRVPRWVLTRTVNGIETQERKVETMTAQEVVDWVDKQPQQ